MFAQRLKGLRKQQGLSQIALAEHLGISQQAVGKWETGRSAPDQNTLRKLADLFAVSVDYLLGRTEMPINEIPGLEGFAMPDAGQTMLPVLGTVRAGYGAYAFEQDCGQEPANVRNAQDYFYLIVRGDSMEPRISDGDLALVRRQEQVENGELAVVLIDGEEGTLKKVVKKDRAVILQPFNPAYQTQVFMGEDLERIHIVGKVVETKARW